LPDQRIQAAGYHVFSLGWSMRGIIVRPVESGSLATDYEAPNFIATANPNEMLTRCTPPGWSVLTHRAILKLAPA